MAAEQHQRHFVEIARLDAFQRNPLRDVRVREAISKMIDRNAITQHLLNGAGVPAGQIVPQGLGGYDPQLQPDAYDPAGAQRLLTQAGYPDGFGLTIHSSNDRFASDSDLGQALGQMLARGGITVNNVVTQPYNVYAGAAARRSYSAFVFGFGNSTSDSAIALTNVLATYRARTAPAPSTARATATRRSTGWCTKHAATFDPAQRLKLLQQAADAGFRDYGIVPLYFPVDYWATRDDVIFHPNKSERTSMHYIEIRQ